MPEILNAIKINVNIFTVSSTIPTSHVHMKN